MHGLITYLNFDGNTREAMTFYRDCLDAELRIHTTAELPHTGPYGASDRVVHARLTKGQAVLMASDSPPGAPLTQGNATFINVDCESLTELERLFTSLSAGGAVLMPLQDTFWGARFGIIRDRYGVQWMFNYDLAEKRLASR
jgi:PhnB protein